MGFFDTFRRKKEPAAAKRPEKATKSVKKAIADAPSRAGQPAAAAPKQQTVREEIAAAEGRPKKGVQPGVFAHRVLMRPVVSEKSARLHGMNQYVFLVAPDANKISIRKAIYEVYHVEPAAIKIITMSGKKVRNRMMFKGQRRSYKKAVICVPKGTTLPVYEGV